MAFGQILAMSIRMLSATSFHMLEGISGNIRRYRIFPSLGGSSIKMTTNFKPNLRLVRLLTLALTRVPMEKLDCPDE